MIPYVRGEKPIIFTAERERDIRSIVKFVEEMKVKAIIIGGQDAWKVADDLKKNNISVIYTNIYNLPVHATTTLTIICLKRLRNCRRRA